MIKRILGWTTVAAALWLAPRIYHPATDVGKLLPVEVVLLKKTENGILLATDAGGTGEGETLVQAVEDLKDGMNREVFLDTTDKLILAGDLGEYREEIFLLFRPACQVCRGNERMDLKAAAEYLRIHPSGQTLSKIKNGMGTIPHLIMEEGSGTFAEE